MAFLTNISHQSCSSQLAFGHQITPHPQNHKISIAPGCNTSHQLKLTNNTSNQVKHCSNPYKTNQSGNHMNSLIAEDENDMKHAELVKRVRTLIDKVDNDRFEDLLMVDALQRLAIDYHFDDEINLILTRRSMQIFQTDLLQHKNLYEVSLCFRILRQNGFHVLADVFMKFKGNNNEFDENLNKDIRGLMALYEASQLRTEGEIILDEAEKFSYQILQETMKFLDEDQARTVYHTLENPYQLTLPYCNLKNSMKDYNGTILQELAELDFSMLQCIHQKELKQISRYKS
ncbi:hypothetical protein L2E82_15203 [Cichorium intybus]|uniref:Uncharacterized protein n=1 Tax=Cichorium intybus TaxID=13427 RepID=A0ACB9F3B8_CICIN|nr:hypothetical protein L2E82_15203 [Cichorium intybus]